MDPMQDIATLLMQLFQRKGALGQLPAEQQGVSPGFGLGGAAIQPSGLADQLRNAERKEGSVPIAPSRIADFSRFVPRVLGIQDPVKVAQLGQKAAELEAAQGWAAQGESGIATLLRQAKDSMAAPPPLRFPK